MPTKKLLTCEWGDHDGDNGEVIGDDGNGVGAEDGEESSSLEAGSTPDSPPGRDRRTQRLHLDPSKFPIVFSG